ncbi:MAG: c-type cytochrome [Salinisphaeraceae bacterium]|nr:c-type cytochrome [Salinisphaeraceae bacterium]
MKGFKVMIANTALALAACSSETEQPQAEHPGAALVKANCKVCHAQGINGAPIIGNNKMWQDRKVKGKDVLVSHAINGFGLMPAKGGKTHLSDEEIAIAVDYMLSQVK